MNDTAIRLRDVPETMLWTLHNRANEARRPAARLKDPELHGAAHWGIDRDRIEPLLRNWSGRVQDVDVGPYGAMRGLPGLALKIASAIPWVRNFPPCIVHVGTDGGYVAEVRRHGKQRWFLWSNGGR